jgi:hypothetical protein
MTWWMFLQCKGITFIPLVKVQCTIMFTISISTSHCVINYVQYVFMFLQILPNPAMKGQVFFVKSCPAVYAVSGSSLQIGKKLIIDIFE